MIIIVDDFSVGYTKIISKVSMDRMQSSMGPVSHQTHPFNSSGHSTNFTGFSHVDICRHVPPEIWEIIPMQGSVSIQVYDELSFDLLEELVCQMHGSPQNSNNGRICTGPSSSDK